MYNTYLGGAIGDVDFVTQFVQHKVASWVEEIYRLSKIAVSQRHAAYAAFTYGV